MNCPKPAFFWLALGLTMVLGLKWTAPSSGQDASVPVESETVAGASEPGIVAVRQEAPAGGVGRESVLSLFRDANPILWPLVLCSVVTLGFALERLVALRRARVIPKDFVERFLDRLSSGKLDRERAAELCRAHESPVARLFGHAIRYWGHPATMIRQAVDADAAGEIAEMKRNVRVLNGTATLAPLLGLFGTVVGMIEAFDALGGPIAEGTDKGRALAHGISLALVATAFGLAIAVISVVLYYYLINRIDLLVRDLDAKVRQVIELISAEAHWPEPDRRHGPLPSERTRAESRIAGRPDPHPL